MNNSLMGSLYMPCDLHFHINTVFVV